MILFFNSQLHLLIGILVGIRCVKVMLFFILDYATGSTK